jgi:small-conductance mechanosensitive channel
MGNPLYFTIGEIVAAFVLAALAARLAHMAIHRMLNRMDIVSPDNRAAVQARAAMLVRALTYLVYGLAALGSVALALSQFGVDTPRVDPRAALQLFLRHGINIVVIVVGATIVIRAANVAIIHLQHKLGRRHGQIDLEWQRRASTLGGVLGRLVTATVSFVAILMLLRELTIDVVPILTGAGIAGLAVGFGAQNLVRDVISGFFIILEDQIRVGDLARINGVTGNVEEINLRTVVLRDGEGAVQVFPSGSITALANLSKQFAYAVVNLRVSYGENMDRVFGIIREVGASMQEDTQWRGLLLEPIHVPGIESLADGAATVRAHFKVLPLNQGKVANELRKRVVSAFVAGGVRPYGSEARR